MEAQKSWNKDKEVSYLSRKLKKLRNRQAVCGQILLENQLQNKHVESATGPMFGRGFESLRVHI